MKNEYVYPQEQYPFGYNGLGSEVLSSGKAAETNGSQADSNTQPPDIKEMFSIGPQDPRSGLPPRRFPKYPENFESAWTAYYDHLNALAQEILKAFAIALNLSEDFFAQFIDHHASALRAINYPAISAKDRVLPGQLRASAHTDYGTITILRADGPGLQVSKDLDPPVWHDVPFVENAFIINLGDLMKRWTNDRWLSTLHRVIVPEADISKDDSNGGNALLCRRRQSMAFFHNINRDAVVEAILSSNNSEDGTPQKAKYEPIVAGDFLLQKHLASIRGKK
jgi:isopenicillin N synthase-like dioxygenase